MSTLRELIRSRRTIFDFQPGALAIDLVRDLVEAGTWAAGRRLPVYLPSARCLLTVTAEAGGASALVGWEDLGDAWSRDSSLAFLGKLAALSGGLAYVVKYAPALVPAGVREAWEILPEGVISALALAVLVLPTALNVAKWQQRSAEDAEFVGDF
jgi:hypothetical protein